MSIRSRLVNQSNKKLQLNSEQLFHSTDLSPITFGEISPPKLCGRISTNFQINPATSDEDKNSKVRTIKTWLDIGASASIVHKDALYERHQILKQKKE